VTNKPIGLFGCKFSQLQYYHILLKSVNIWPSNHKNKKRELFRDSVYSLCGALAMPICPNPKHAPCWNFRLRL